MTIGVPKEIKEQAYRVANLPGAHVHTATQALTNVTYRYLEMLADYGIEEASAKNPALIGGIKIKNAKLLTGPRRRHMVCCSAKSNIGTAATQLEAAHFWNTGGLVISATAVALFIWFARLYSSGKFSCR